MGKWSLHFSALPSSNERTVFQILCYDNNLLLLGYLSDCYNFHPESTQEDLLGQACIEENIALHQAAVNRWTGTF